MLTLQQLFDNAVTSYRTPGWKSQLCQAVSVYLQAPIILLVLSGFSLPREVAIEMDSTLTRIQDLYPYIGEHSSRPVKDLQYIHDRSQESVSLEPELQAYAKLYNLNYELPN